MIQSLKGIRIVNLGINVPGPVAAARLAEMGASVTKIEPPSGDPLAGAAVDWYKTLTKDQDVLVLDLKDESGRRELFGILGTADLVLTGQRPSALRRLSLDWGSLHARFPRLCQVAIVGHPSPNEEAPGHDLSFLAHLGLLRPPDLPLTLVADLAGAERAVSAALGLLLARERGEEAGYAEVALADAAAAFAKPLEHGLTRPGGILGGGLSTYNLYATKDGHIAVAALEPHFLTRLLKALELPSASRDEFARVFLTRTSAEWEAWAKEHDLPIAAVRAPGAQ